LLPEAELRVAGRAWRSTAGVLMSHKLFVAPPTASASIPLDARHFSQL
jgi:hypothetical protein